MAENNADLMEEASDKIQAGDPVKMELEEEIIKTETVEIDAIKTELTEDENVQPDKITSLKSLGPFIASKSNACNTVYITDIPSICKDQPCMLGVDEAGRGPVLGPMVYGIAFCPLESKQALIDLGCADSKQLTEEKRDIIFDDMHSKEYAKSCIGWAVEIISPNVISTSMYRRSKCSLNEVSMNSAIGLIHSAIDAGVNIAEVYVDTVGPPEKYQEKLKNIFPQFEITVAKKADSTYPIVSAASICAKVTRDHALKVWKFPEGLPEDVKFGSGYPGDPVTKSFLVDNIDMVFGFPRLVRFSWSTAENALADKAYDVEFDEPDSEKPKYASAAKMTEFFKETTKAGEIKRQKCRFLKERFLDNVMEF